LDSKKNVELYSDAKDWDDIVTIKPYLKIHKELQYLFYRLCDKNDMVRISSERLLMITTYVYLLSLMISW